MSLRSLFRPAKPLYHWLRVCRIRAIVQQNLPDGIFAVDVASNNGLGAKLQNCLEIFAFCDDHGLIPRIRFTHRNDSSQTDYFDRFFFVRPAKEVARTPVFPRIYWISDLGFPVDYDKTLTLERADHLIGKYLGIKAPILAEVDSFCQEHFQSGHVLGVHYRGTDKHLEAPTVSYARVLRNIVHYIDKFPRTQAVFVSTDDQDFLSTVNQASLPRRVIARRDSYRSTDGRAVHCRTGVDRTSVYRDALVNCLLLSRCSTLLKSASFLSDWSCLFNPRLELVMLNRPHEHTTWFPARELLKRSLYHALD